MKQPDLSGRLARWVMKLQAFKFTISHRKGKDHVVPDALSRIPCDNVCAIEFPEQEIDLNSEHFHDIDYKELRKRVVENQEKFPDIKVIDQYVYIRVQHYSGSEEQQEKCWKLWVPTALRNSLIARSHNSTITAHGGMAKTLELV